MTPASVPLGLFLAPGILYALLGAAALLAAGLAAAVLYYRSQARLLAEHAAMASAPALNTSAWHPDRHLDHDAVVDEMRQRHARLQRTYEVLLSRHKTLIREFQRVQQSTPGRPRPRPAHPAKAHANA